MKLLCDEMLNRLGRWLRAAGHDTAIVGPGSSDAAVLQRAAAEGRRLLTRDAHLATNSGRGHAITLLRSDGIDAQARELRTQLGIDWLQRPFSRCVVDNVRLRGASAAERAAAPPRARAMGGAFTVCPSCGRLYWPGSHHRRMQARLAAWNRDDGRTTSSP